MMKSPYSNNILNVCRFFIDEAIVCSTNWLIQKQLTKYRENLQTHEVKHILWQYSKNKYSQINWLVLQNLFLNSYQNLSFCEYCYCEEVS